MNSRIDIITLAVDDLERALHFYRRVFRTDAGEILGTEYLEDDKNAAGAIALFEVEGGPFLSLYPRAQLAKDAHVKASAAKTGDFSLGHFVAAKDEVDAWIGRARDAGGTITEDPRDRPWGIYSAYF
ncbi:MAG TPA: VOC family protein, partial [Candidatus Eremiobacteraceae bacterium]|nr:VOC family protein [Candidatus Eremiobacteraceae bacterium]